MKSNLTADVLCLIAMVILVSNGNCSKNGDAVVPAFDTILWTRPERGTLFVKRATDGTDDLLFVNVLIDSTYVLRDQPTISAKKIADGRPIFRYVGDDPKLIEVPPAAWDEAQGELLMCGLQERLYNYGVFTHDLNTKLLQFNGKVVPTAGPTVLKALPDPSKTYVAVLSATGKVRGSSIPFGDPTVDGERYHQLFRMVDAAEVGKPLKLKVKTDRDYISPCWSPDGRFLVYHDASEHLWIIDMTIYLTEREGKWRGGPG